MNIKSIVIKLKSIATLAKMNIKSNCRRTKKVTPGFFARDGCRLEVFHGGRSRIADLSGNVDKLEESRWGESELFLNLCKYVLGRGPYLYVDYAVKSDGFCPTSRVRNQILNIWFGFGGSNSQEVILILNFTSYGG